MKKKIFIALPTKRYVEPECEDFIAEKIFRSNNTYEVGDYVKLRNSPNIYMQRHNLAKRFLEGDCDYYFYLDTDQSVTYPDNPVELLIEGDKDIISPLIVRTIFPHLPAAMSFRQKKFIDRKERYFEDFRKYPKDRPFEVYYSCGGLCLIKRKVIKAVDKPFLPIENEKGELLSTDYALYYKAKKLGFKCWIEPRIIAAHFGMFPYLIDDYYAVLDSGQISFDEDKSEWSLKDLRG